MAVVEAWCNELQVSLQVMGLDLVEWDLGIQSSGTPTLTGSLEAMKPKTSVHEMPRHLFVLGKKERWPTRAFHKISSKGPRKSDWTNLRKYINEPKNSKEPKHCLETNNIISIRKKKKQEEPLQDKSLSKEKDEVHKNTEKRKEKWAQNLRN